MKGIIYHLFIKTRDDNMGLAQQVGDMPTKNAGRARTLNSPARILI